MERFDFYNKLIEENKEQERKLHQRMMEGNENLKRTLKKIKKDMEKVSLYSNVNYDAFKSDPQVSNSTMQNQYDMKFTSSNSNNFSESLNMHHNNKQMNLTEPQSLIDAKHKNNNFTFKDNVKGGSDVLKENDEMLQTNQLLEGSGVDYRKYGNVGSNEELPNEIQSQQRNNAIVNDNIQLHHQQQQQQPIMNMRKSVDSNNDYSAEEIEEKVLTGSNQDIMQTESIKEEIGNVKVDEMEFQTQQQQQQHQPQQPNLNEDKLFQQQFQHKQFDKEQTSPQFSQHLSQQSPSKTTQSYHFAGGNAPLDSNAHFNIASSNISNKDILSNTNNTMNNIFYQQLQNPQLSQNQFNQSQSQNYSQRQYQQYPSQFQQHPEISSTSIYNNQSQSQTANNFYNQTNLPPNSSPSVNLTNNAQLGSDAYSQLTYNKNLNNITSSQIDNTSQVQFYPNPSNPNANGFQKAFPQNNNSNYEMSQTFNSKSSASKVKKNIPQQDDHYFSYKNPEVHPDDIYAKSYLRGYKIKSSHNNLKRKLTPKEKEYVKLNQETAIAKSRQLYLERLNKKQQEEAKRNYLNVKKMSKKQNVKGSKSSSNNNDNDLDNKRKFASNDYEEYKIYEQKVMDKLAKEELYADVGNTRDLLGEFVDRVIERSLYLYKNRHCHSCARLLSKGKSTEGCPKCHHLLQVRNIKG